MLNRLRISALVVPVAAVMLTAVGAGAQSHHTDSTGSASGQQTPAGVDRNAALSHLKDLHTSISRLTERSMSQDARMAFGTLTKESEQLSRSYNNEKNNWRSHFDAAERSLTTLIGRRDVRASSPEASTGARPGVPGIPDAVRVDLRSVGEQLDQFWTSATGAPPATGGPKQSSPQ